MVVEEEGRGGATGVWLLSFAFRMDDAGRNQDIVADATPVRLRGEEIFQVGRERRNEREKSIEFERQGGGVEGLARKKKFRFQPGVQSDSMNSR